MVKLLAAQKTEVSLHPPMSKLLIIELLIILLTFLKIQILASNLFHTYKYSWFLKDDRNQRKDLRDNTFQNVSDSCGSMVHLYSGRVQMLWYTGLVSKGRSPECVWSAVDLFPLGSQMLSTRPGVGETETRKNIVVLCLQLSSSYSIQLPLHTRQKG